MTEMNMVKCYGETALKRSVGNCGYVRLYGETSPSLLIYLYYIIYIKYYNLTFILTILSV